METLSILCTLLASFPFLFFVVRYLRKRRSDLPQHPLALLFGSFNSAAASRFTSSFSFFARHHNSSPLLRLPVCMLARCNYFLPLRDIVSFSRTCRDWHEVTRVHFESRTSLDLSMAGSHVVAMCQSFLPLCPALQSLDLRINSIGPTSCYPLASWLVHSRHLQHFNISYNSIGDVGTSALSATFPIWSSLTTIALSGSGIGEAGMRALAQSLPHCPLLNRLDLSDNRISDDGAIHLVSLLAHSPALRILDVSDNNIGEKGAAVIVTALCASCPLQHLDLCRNHVGDQGALLFASALPQCLHLRLVEMGYNGIGQVGRQALKTTRFICPSLSLLVDDSES